MPTTIKLPTAKFVHDFVKSTLAALAKEKDSAVADIRNAFGTAEDKNHVEKRAIAIAIRLHKLPDSKLQQTMYHLTHYIAALGLWERALRQGQLDLDKAGVAAEGEDGEGGEPDRHRREDRRDATEETPGRDRWHALAGPEAGGCDGRRDQQGHAGRLSSNLCIVGVDPGSHGCAAFLTGSGASARIELFDLPYVDGHLDYRAYRDLLRRWTPNAAYIKNVWPRSSRAPKNKGAGMGFISASKFMDNVGALKGITACEVDDCHLVTPVSWKRSFSCSSSPRAICAGCLPN